MANLRSSLALKSTSRRDPEQVKREGWQEFGLLAVRDDDQRLDPFEREVIARIGRRLYGPRGGGVQGQSADTSGTANNGASNGKRLNASGRPMTGRNE